MCCVRLHRPDDAFFDIFLGRGNLFGGSALYRASRMAEGGEGFGGGCCVVSVYYVPACGIVMLSTSISDEIYHKTLGVLMTTPINSFQIVAGKL